MYNPQQAAAALRQLASKVVAQPRWLQGSRAGQRTLMPTCETRCAGMGGNGCKRGWCRVLHATAVVMVPLMCASSAA